MSKHKSRNKANEYRRLKYNTKHSDREKHHTRWKETRRSKRVDVETINPKNLIRKGMPDFKMPHYKSDKELRKKVTPCRGEIWYANLGEYDFKSVQRGRRPVIIISSDESNRNSSTVTILPMTSKMKHTEMPTHVLIESSDITVLEGIEWCLVDRGLVMVEQIRAIDKADLIGHAGSISDDRMTEIEASLRAWTGV